ncbi:MAG: lysophospholipid acyltransferase family protein [Jaaginema sp. PMC 1079.18]|nr:lysophospholipid acyltransferase family protein [Jaaginema sp. PMC 1080.18]MEC4852514.1 lysophospholipid acyltransferase family protein [Jaaginema sp. PMC 1079.18]MEC4865391.1 lysophospholipid acyltransferase family protein [Jaaginema sp. PMC 1078.18]
MSNTPISASISPWLTRIVYPLGKRVVLPLYFGNLQVTGQEHIPTEGPVIVAPTHRARWDALIVPFTTGRIVSGRDLYFMISANEYRGLQGWFMKRLGGFPVDPQRPTISTLRYSVDLLCQGQMLVIFPEGDIYKKRQVQPLKRGVGSIALEAQSRLSDREVVKVLPLSIHYSDFYPTWGTDIKVDIGKPLAAIDYMGDSPKQRTQRLMSDLQSALQDIHNVEQSTADPFCMAMSS